MTRTSSELLPPEPDQLFVQLAEQLHNTFLQITRTAELAPTLTSEEQEEYWRLLRTVSEASMHITAGYTLQARLNASGQPVPVEPFTASSLLYDVAQSLDEFAKRYGVALQLDRDMHSHPIIGNRELLTAAMISLGQVFVVAESQRDEPSFVRFSAHQSRYGVVAGVYGEQGELNAGALRRARSLLGKTTQPFAKLAAGPVAGVFVAESLLQPLDTKLHVARYHNLTGLAATLPSCNQLQLV